MRSPREEGRFLARILMTVRHEMSEWHATSARNEIRVTCEPGPCHSRFSRQSRPSHLSQASAITAEVFMNNAG